MKFNKVVSSEMTRASKPEQPQLRTQSTATPYLTQAFRNLCVQELMPLWRRVQQEVAKLPETTKNIKVIAKTVADTSRIFDFVLAGTFWTAVSPILDVVGQYRPTGQETDAQKIAAFNAIYEVVDRQTDHPQATGQASRFIRRLTTLEQVLVDSDIHPIEMGHLKKIIGLMTSILEQYQKQHDVLFLLQASADNGNFNTEIKGEISRIINDMGAEELDLLTRNIQRNTPRAKLPEGELWGSLLVGLLDQIVGRCATIGHGPGSRRANSLRTEITNEIYSRYSIFLKNDPPLPTRD